MCSIRSAFYMQWWTPSSSKNEKDPPLKQPLPRLRARCDSRFLFAVPLEPFAKSIKVCTVSQVLHGIMLEKKIVALRKGLFSSNMIKKRKVSSGSSLSSAASRYFLPSMQARNVISRRDRKSVFNVGWWSLGWGLGGRRGGWGGGGSVQVYVRGQSDWEWSTVMWKANVVVEGTPTPSRRCPPPHSLACVVNSINVAASLLICPYLQYSAMFYP